MEKLRHRLSIFIFFLTFLASCAFAQSTLTQVQDTVLAPDGTTFSGTVVITWTGSTDTTGNSPAPYNTSVKIYNGALSVLLVPSTTVSPLGYYQALFSSSNGLVTWSETWSVPPSATPVTLSQIRVANPSGSGSGGAQFPISQVSGLSSYLDALNGSLVSLTGLFNGLNSTVGNLSNSVATLTAQMNASPRERPTRTSWTPKPRPEHWMELTLLLPCPRLRDRQQVSCSTAMASCSQTPSITRLTAPTSRLAAMIFPNPATFCRLISASPVPDRQPISSMAKLHREPSMAAT